jgi:signal transduction histidine kinase
MLYVSVKDTGTGIPEKEIGKIFSEFCTLKSNSNLNPNGVGLGLSICKKICNQLDGDIVLESKVGFGSTFTFHVRAEFVSNNSHTG